MPFFWTESLQKWIKILATCTIICRVSESHLATLNAQIDVLEHHVEMLNQANMHGKCSHCMMNEGLPNYEDVVASHSEESRLLPEQLPIGLPVQQVLQSPQVQVPHSGETQTTEAPEAEPEQNNGPFLHV
uniref:Polyprotein n=1 Tax=Steinernema glaseri TaxID=37863 RepID=A0A1I8AME7_9BILA